MTFHIDKFINGKMAGFSWWKFLAMLIAGEIMAFGMGLRYGGVSFVWIPMAAVCVGVVTVSWWIHSQSRQAEFRNDESGP